VFFFRRFFEGFSPLQPFGLGFPQTFPFSPPTPGNRVPFFLPAPFCCPPRVKISGPPPFGGNSFFYSASAQVARNFPLFGAPFSKALSPRFLGNSFGPPFHRFFSLILLNPPKYPWLLRSYFLSFGRFFSIDFEFVFSCPSITLVEVLNILQKMALLVE